MKAFEVTMSGIAKKVFTVVANNNEEAIKKRMISISIPT